MRRRLVAALLGVCFAALAQGHEVRPAFLQIEAADDPGAYAVLWKQPTLGGRVLPIVPVFPDDCTASASSIDASVRDALVRRFTLNCADGLHGQTVRIDGLAGTITDVMLHVTLADGTQFSQLLKPGAAAATIGGGGPQVLAYLILGIEHLLFGYDHILFVVSLMFFTAPVSLAGHGRTHPAAAIGLPCTRRRSSRPSPRSRPPIASPCPSPRWTSLGCRRRPWKRSSRSPSCFWR